MPRSSGMRVPLLLLAFAIATHAVLASSKDAVAFAGSSESRASVMAHVAGNFALKGFVHSTGEETTPSQNKQEQEMLTIRREVESHRNDIEELARKPVPLTPLGNSAVDRAAVASLEEALRGLESQSTPALVETGSKAATSHRSRALMRALEHAKTQLQVGQQGIGDRIRNLVGRGKRFFSNNPKFLAVKYEDCLACRYIWSQVEMDVANARYVEDVQASFEHNCLDAQKTEIFYKACEDMYDDMYAITDDYMTNEYTVDTMCKRANMCKTGANDNGIHRVFTN